MKSGPATHKPNKKQKPNGKLYWKRWFDCFFMHDFLDDNLPGNLQGGDPEEDISLPSPQVNTSGHSGVFATPQTTATPEKSLRARFSRIIAIISHALGPKASADATNAL